MHIRNTLATDDPIAETLSPQTQEMSRIRIEIDERLLARAIRLTEAKSKSEAVEIALRRLVGKASLYRAIRGLRGKLTSWEGNIDALRRDRRSPKR